MANLDYLDVLQLVEETERLIIECEYRMSEEDREKVTHDARSVNMMLERLEVLIGRVRAQM